MSGLSENRYPVYDNPKSQLVFFSMLVAIGYLLAMLIIASIAPFFPDAFNEQKEIASAPYLRVAQVIQFAVLMFAPVVLYLTTVGTTQDKLAFNAPQRKAHYFYAVTAFAVALPAIDYLANLNRMLELPTWLGGVQNWMAEGEKTSDGLVQLMLDTRDQTTILLNFAIMVVLPAICEEFLFRGVFQAKLTQMWKSPVLAIGVTAFLFSAIHFQFLTFLPRFIQGIALGYLFYASRSIWVSVAAHLANNLLALMFYYYVRFNHPDLDPQKVDTTSGSIWLVLGSFVLATYFILKVRPSTEVLKADSVDNR